MTGPINSTLFDTVSLGMSPYLKDLPAFLCLRHLLEAWGNEIQCFLRNCPLISLCVLSGAECGKVCSSGRKLNLPLAVNFELNVTANKEFDCSYSQRCRLIPASDVNVHTTGAEPTKFLNQKYLQT